MTRRRLASRVLTLLVAAAAGAASVERWVQAQSSLWDARLYAGLTLRTIGPATMSGRVVDLTVVESTPNTFYVATATGGVWKTIDNGVTLWPVFFNEAVHSVGCVAVHQARPDIVWVGTGEATNRQSVSWGDGVYKSVDGGRTWTNMGLRDTRHVARIVLHPTNPDIVYVAAAGHLFGPNNERGLYKSVDGGRSWRRVLFVDEDTGVSDVVLDPGDPKILYAAAYQRRRTAFGFNGGGPGSGLYASTDSGATWHRLGGGLPTGDTGRISLSVYRKDPRIVYASVEQGERYNASTAYEVRKGGVYRSENRGDSWTRMSDWNPRPMYGSRIVVDPTDDKRVFMVNEFSVSEDGGRTFTVPPQSLHGDDRVVWVDPRDSRHLIKGDDGGVGISYDRGRQWLYLAALPVSQFYRVSVDSRKPYWIYGGLQDNGSWAGPSANYFSGGILNDAWVRTGGGDGFFNVIDPRDNHTLYTSSQFLGLSRFDMVTFERKDIRPGNRTGFIQARRNWTVWGRSGIRAPELGNTMAPANWDAPVIVSPHDPHTIYAGTNHLWRSDDRGDTWTDLGDRTTGVDRATLAIMNQTPSERTLSLDDGVPYYPTITAIAESPLSRGLLYVGSDDGSLQVSRDSGRAWMRLESRIPGLPKASWVAGVEPSRWSEGTVYAAFDNHRSDDYRNYLYRSTDYGATWASITGDLPADRVLRTVREDPKNPNLIYVGTELGFFFSPDRGSHWIELKNNLPRVAVYDFVVHPRDNDLVLATHGRGIWILDNISAIQELTPEIMARRVHVFTPRPAEMIRYRNPKAHAGDMIFRGENPPEGAIIDYYLRQPGSHDVVLTVHDRAGNIVATVEGTHDRGVNRSRWDLRYPPLGSAAAGTPEERESRLPGPWVAPGTYTIRLTSGGESVEQPLEVLEDPRIEVDPATRRVWTETLLEVGQLYNEATAIVAALPASGAAPGDRDFVRQARELKARLRTLYGNLSEHVGTPTADQRSQITYFGSLIRVLEPRLKTGSR